MRPLVIIAGTSVEVHDALRRQSESKFAPNGKLFAKPVGRPGYPTGQGDQYIQEIEQYIRKLREDEPLSITVVYVNYENDPSTEKFLDRFFPFALIRPIDPLKLDDIGTRSRLNAALTRYINQIYDEVLELRRIASLVRGKTHAQNLSPLLLPVRNFESAAHRSFLSRLFYGLGRDPQPEEFLDGEIRAFLSHHPRTTPPSDKQSCYCDGRLYFKSPGRNRHGHHRHQNGQGHSPTCLLNARTRLGGSYDHSLHYDCVPVRNLLATYPNCHDMATPPRERHVNIAPNDYII